MFGCIVGAGPGAAVSGSDWARSGVRRIRPEWRSNDGQRPATVDAKGVDRELMGWREATKVSAGCQATRERAFGPSDARGPGPRDRAAAGADARLAIGVAGSQPVEVRRDDVRRVVDIVRIYYEGGYDDVSRIQEGGQRPGRSPLNPRAAPMDGLTKIFRNAASLCKLRNALGNRVAVRRLGLNTTALIWSRTAA